MLTCCLRLDLARQLLRWAVGLFLATAYYLMAQLQTFVFCLHNEAHRLLQDQRFLGHRVKILGDHSRNTKVFSFNPQRRKHQRTLLLLMK